MRAGAERFLGSFAWCGGVAESYFGLGVGGIVAVFLFRIRPARAGVDEWLWVVTGDLPPAYLVTDQAPNPACALEGSIDRMREWAGAARRGRPVVDSIPVNVPPTPEWANKLAGRLDVLEEHVLGSRKRDLGVCRAEPRRRRSGRKRPAAG